MLPLAALSLCTAAAFIVPAPAPSSTRAAAIRADVGVRGSTLTCMANAVTNGLLSGSKYCLNVKICVEPGRREEFISCIRDNQAGTLSTEPLAIEYVWGEDQSEPNTFHFFEKYEGRKGFEAHQATPHFAAWEEFASSDPFTSVAGGAILRGDVSNGCIR